jgi:hypothetical protein
MLGEIVNQRTTKQSRAKLVLFDRSVTPLNPKVKKSFEFKVWKDPVIFDSRAISNMEHSKHMMDSEDSPVERKVITEMRQHLKSNNHQK